MIERKLNLGSVMATWIEGSSLVEAEYIAAAIRLADHASNGLLDGTSDQGEVYRVEFDCAINKRNRMLFALADKALSDIADTVKETEAYQQYVEGLITSVECCNALTLEACRKAA